MKVAFLIPAIDAKGPNIFTYNLILSLIKRKDFECEVFHFSRDRGDATYLNFPVKVHALSLYKKYDFSGFDIIHSTMPIPDIYVSFHELRKKYICITSMHCIMKEDLYQRKGKVKGYIESLIWSFFLKKNSNIIVSSEAMKIYYNKLLDNGIEYKKIPYGIPRAKPDITKIDKSTQDALLIFKQKYTVLCGCGSLIKRKGFWQLINYLSYNVNSAVVLIGDGECKIELENLAKKMHVQNRVLFLGFRNESLNYYPYFDIFCMCSNSEGFGLAMLEAISFGLPLVCSNLNIYEDYFGDGKVSLFDFGNQDEFNHAVDKVICNMDYYRRSSLEVFSSFFSLDSLAENHYTYYKELLSIK